MNRLAVLLVLLFACKTSASYSSGSGTANPDDHGKPAQQPAGDAGGAPGAPSADGGSAPAGSAPAPCVTAMSDTSTSLFSGRIVIKLPKGLELVEQNSFYAVAAAPQSTTSCGGIIKYAAAGFFQQPANTETTAVRDHLLELRGISAETITWSEEGAKGRSYTAAYTAAVDAKTGAPETKGWLVMRDAPNDKYLYFAMFESDPAAFDGLKAAFQEAGRKLLVKPRAQQAADPVVAGPTDKPVLAPKPKAK